MPIEERISFCRICSGGCGVRLTVDENERILSVRGDPDSPLTGGYACFKGLQEGESHHGPARLLHPLKRQPDGSFPRIEIGIASCGEGGCQSVESAVVGGSS